MNNEKPVKRKIKRFSTITEFHYVRLVFRSLLFIAAFIIYILGRNSILSTEYVQAALFVIWVVFVFEMILRFFPSKYESMGCQKQFPVNYEEKKADAKTTEKIRRSNIKAVIIIAAVWIILNGIIGALYLTAVIDSGITLLVSLFFSICDMICILFFCPFQSWIMKNRCCGNCRIYNWDYMMMFTPLLFVKSYLTWSLCACAVVLLLRWEISYYRHPERFSEVTNACLDCSNCKEKLCRHKKTIQKFLKDQKRRFLGE